MVPWQRPEPPRCCTPPVMALRNLEGAHLDDTHQRWTALFRASENNHADVVALLIDARANVNAATQRERNAASVAVAPPNGRAPAAEALLLLVKARADLSPPDKNTPRRLTPPPWPSR